MVMERGRCWWWFRGDNGVYEGAPYGRKENEFFFKWVFSFGCWFLEVWRKKGFCFNPCFDNGDRRVANVCVFGFIVARRR